MPSLLGNHRQLKANYVYWMIEIWRGNKLFMIFSAKLICQHPLWLVIRVLEKKHKFPTVPNGKTIMIGKKERIEKEQETKFSAGRSSCVPSYSWESLVESVAWLIFFSLINVLIMYTFQSFILNWLLMEILNLFISWSEMLIQ